MWVESSWAAASWGATSSATQKAAKAAPVLDPILVLPLFACISLIAVRLLRDHRDRVRARPRRGPAPDRGAPDLADDVRADVCLAGAVAIGAVGVRVLEGLAVAQPAV